MNKPTQCNNYWWHLYFFLKREEGEMFRHITWQTGTNLDIDIRNFYLILDKMRSDEKCKKSDKTPEMNRVKIQISICTFIIIVFFIIVFIVTCLGANSPHCRLYCLTMSDCVTCHSIWFMLYTSKSSLIYEQPSLYCIDLRHDHRTLMLTYILISLGTYIYGNHIHTG